MSVTKQENTYGKIYALGHRAIGDILTHHVIIEEKIDGSQFTFKVIDNELHCYSRNNWLGGDISKLFKPAVATVTELFEAGMLNPEYTYRGEAIHKPRHNTLEYGRMPKGGLIIYDIDRGIQNYLSYEEKCREVERLDLEIVPLLGNFPNGFDDRELFKGWMDLESRLGKCKIEGVVIKAYDRFSEFTGKIMMAKFVSEAFKEKNNSGHAKPGRKDIILELGDIYTSNVRWRKAVERRRDAGELMEAPEDIGPLIGMIQKDVHEECADEIKEVLFKWAWKLGGLSRQVTKGFPEWYKMQLAEQAFSQPIVLSEEGAQNVLDAIANPNQPTEALKKLFAEEE